MALVATLISFCALATSAFTAWLTLFRRGKLQMTRPAVIFFGPDGPPSQGQGLKVYLRTLLYSTSKRGHIVEGMFVTLRRGESVQTFNIWVYGSKNQLSRGSGLRVAEDGVIFDHHFVLPRDGTPFLFVPGHYVVEVYATVVGAGSSQLLSRIDLDRSQDQAAAISKGAGVHFDWGPDAKCYHAHIDAVSAHDILAKLADRPFA